MSKYRNALPQLSTDLFLTDSGLETILIFHQEIDLPDFASFPLLDEDQGRQTLKNYYSRHAAIAKRNNVGIVLDTPTWRASADWGVRLGFDKENLDRLNRMAVDLLLEVQEEFDEGVTRVVVSGILGPRGDGYDPGEIMSEISAEHYHQAQVNSLVAAGADTIGAVTITNTQEAIGIVRAAQSNDIPVYIGFTVETDGNLPTGQALKDAIQAVDQATDTGPVYYIVNCAHPNHFDNILSTSEPWLGRIRGVRVNASKMSHAELDDAEELDDGNPDELGRQVAALKTVMPNLNVLGGCCGTDHRHIEAICSSCID
jgi:S-methylmethionine-dependent homocysteine/selenocysteine methylase